MDLASPLPATGVRRAALRAGFGDGLALLALGASVWYLAGHDGGYETGLRGLFLAGSLTLAAVPAAAAEATRLPRPVRLVLGLWGLGALAALGLAAERTDFVHPTLIYGMVPLVGLLAMRLWRRPWGPAALLAVLAAGLGRYWYYGFLGWWGGQLSGFVRPRWLPLSWHNQSGALMGAFGLLMLGPALAGRRLVAVAGGVGSAAGLAGLWLAGSRGAVVTACLGMAVLTVAAVRWSGWRRPLLRLAGVGAATAVLVFLLLGDAPGGSGPGQPVLTRPEPAPLTLALRLDHVRAAWGMFLDRPATGHGPGSYRRIAPSFTTPSAPLTSAAHSEPAEALAEGGLAFGLPFAALWALSAFAVAAAAVRPRRRLGAADGGIAVGLALGSVGTVAMLGAHAALDFDWLFPVLPCLMAVGAGILAVQGGWVAEPRGSGLLPTVPVALVLAVGLAGAAFHLEAGRTAPWDAPARLRLALDLSSQGLDGAARRQIEGVEAWSPGDPGLPTVRAVVEYRAGRATADELLGTLERGRSRFAAYNLAAEVLIDGGHHEQARSALEEVLEAYPAHAAWRPEEHAAATRLLLVRLEGEAAGCAAAREEARRAAGDPLVGTPRLEAALLEYAERFCA